jgi:hypothetical protein
MRERETRNGSNLIEAGLRISAKKNPRERVSNWLGFGIKWWA